MRVLYACIVFCLLSGCALHLGPSIGANLPSNPDMAQKVFDQRVQERYPIGSSEAALITDLRQQGFSISNSIHGPPGRFQKFAIDCSYVSVFPGHTWEILWAASDDRITDIGSVFIQNCH